MANPQAENGYMRIANEVWQQIMMSDFNREQRGILDLVLRLSWGCGKKVAYIPKQKHFCLAGVYESHIKRELTWLEKANVLIVDWDRRLFQLNKDYETWRVSIVRGYDEESLEQLVRENLRPESRDLQISKPDLPISKNDLQISKKELTYKEELTPPNPLPDGPGGLPKDNIKTYKDNTKTADEVSPSVGSDGQLDQVLSAYHQHIGMMGPGQLEKLRDWQDIFGLSPDLIVTAIERTAEERSKGGVKRGAFNYLEGILRNWCNDGIKTMADLQRREANRNGRTRAGPAPGNGAPNSEAYTEKPDLVAKWREVYGGG